MARFGRNPYPKRFGGGQTELEIEHQALLDAYAKGWDAAGAEHYIETYAWALALTMIWRINGRLKNQAIPSKMLEALPEWEEILRLPASPDDSAQVRRSRVAAKLRGFVGNAIGDLEAAAALAAGPNFVALAAPDPSQVWRYWPGMNPGPPGYEWATNDCSVTVVVTHTGLSDADFVSMLDRIAVALEPLEPMWMTFNIGVDAGGFVVGAGTLGLTLMAPPPPAPTILDVPNLVEFWESGVGLGVVGGLVDGAHVVSWTGQKGGNVFGVVGALPGPQAPTIVVNAFGDNTVDLVFDGAVPQRITLYTFPLGVTTQTLTAFMLLRGSYGGAAGIIFERSDNYASDLPSFELEDGGTAGFTVHAKGTGGLDTWTSTDALDGAARHYLEATVDFSRPSGSELAARLDAAASGSATASINNFDTLSAKSLSLGARTNNTLGGTFRIAAIGFIAGVPSTADRAQILAYLRAKFPATV